MAQPTFVLIHGFQHNGATWYPLVEALGRLGAPAVTLDLPCEDPEAGLRDYADIVLSRIEPLDDVVLVAHSLGGLTAPIVAAERRVRRLTLLCASIPEVGMSHDEQCAAAPDISTECTRRVAQRLELADDGMYAPFREEDAIDLFYHDCSPALQRWALTQLRRQGPRMEADVSPLVAWPDVPLQAIICRDDHMVSGDWHRRVLRERFDIAPEELPGGHSPFLARPAELADLLVQPERV